MMCGCSTAKPGPDSHDCALPQRRGHGKARRGSVPSRAPNIALEPTASSLRSCLAAASSGGTPRALGALTQWQTGLSGGQGNYMHATMPDIPGNS